MNHTTELLQKAQAIYKTYYEALLRNHAEVTNVD